MLDEMTWSESILAAIPGPRANRMKEQFMELLSLAGAMPRITKSCQIVIAMNEVRPVARGPPPKEKDPEVISANLGR